MVDAVISTSLFTLFDEIGTELDSGRYAPADTYASELGLFNQAQGLYTPTLETLSSSLIQFSLPVPGLPSQLFHIALSGSGIGPVSSLSALETAIQNGVATGTINALTVRLGTTAIASLALSPSGYTLTTGAEKITISGHMPNTFASIFDLVGLLSQADMNTIEVMTSAERSAFFSDLAAYGITGLSMSTASSGAMTTVLSLQITDTTITLSNDMMRMVLQGTFPTDFGEVASAAYEMWTNAIANGGSADPSELTQLGVDSFYIADAAGTHLLDGTDLLYYPSDVVLNGTTGADVIDFWDVPFVDIRGGDTLAASLGAGNDSFRMDVHDFYMTTLYEGWVAADLTDVSYEVTLTGDGRMGVYSLMQISLDGGVGTDTLAVASWPYEGRTEIDLGSGTITGFDPTHSWQNPDSPLWSIDIANFEVLSLEGGPFFVTGTAGADTVVLGDVQNVFGAAALTFEGGLGSDILDLSQVGWWSSNYNSGMSQAEFLANYSFSVTDEGYLVASAGNSIWGAPWQIQLQGVEYLRFEGSATLYALSNIHITTTLNGIPGEVFIGGDAGDSVVGTAFGEVIHGGNGNDTINGNAGNDTLYGDDGSDTLIGGDGDDRIYCGASADDLRDVVYAGTGDDWVDGGYGNDSLRGDDGNDTIEGGFGADTVVGGAGNDVLTGSAWSDLIFGNDGDDFINGGFGNDRVNGGAGADRFFHIGAAGHGSDWIQDYSGTDNDVLVFGIASATRAQFQINWATTNGAGDAGVQEAFVIYRPTGQIMWALIDGAANDHIWLQIGGATYDLLA